MALLRSPTPSCLPPSLLLLPPFLVSCPAYVNNALHVIVFVIVFVHIPFCMDCRSSHRNPFCVLKVDNEAVARSVKQQLAQPCLTAAVSMVPDGSS